MDAPMPPDDHATTVACPWCSAAVTPETAVCPSCNAILISDEEHDLPGLTSVAEVAAAREKRPAARGRFLSWLAGEASDQPGTPVDAHAIAPPDVDVQREILRLELEAQISNLQAEAVAMKADALVEGRDLPEALRSFEPAGESAESPEETAGDAAGETTAETAGAPVEAAVGADTNADATTA